PKVIDSSGSLTSQYTLRGTETLSVNGSDSASGVYRVRMLVDGAVKAMPVVSTNAGKCVDINPDNADPYEFASDQPCKNAAAGSFDFDTPAARDGPHELALKLEDAGGNAAPIVAPRTVVVANPPPVNTGAPDWRGGSDAVQPRPGT